MKKKYWLLDYFIRPNNELAPSYVKKVEKFLTGLRERKAARLIKLKKCLKKKPKK
tara:strand:+ start:330 stop:494 length:165 start_codon:yes stop_codon:yes gene_type:complete